MEIIFNLPPNNFRGERKIQKIFETCHLVHLNGVFHYKPSILGKHPVVGCWLLGFFQGLPLLVGFHAVPPTNVAEFPLHSQGQAHAPAGGQLGHGHLKPAWEFEHTQIWYQKKKTWRKPSMKNKVSVKNLWKQTMEKSNLFFLFHMISYDDLDTKFASSWWIFQFLLERKGSGLMLPFHAPRYLIVNMSQNFL